MSSVTLLNLLLHCSLFSHVPSQLLVLLLVLVVLLLLFSSPKHTAITITHVGIAAGFVTR